MAIAHRERLPVQPDPRLSAQRPLPHGASLLAGLVVLLSAFGHGAAWAGDADSDTVGTIIAGLEYNESLVPRGRGIYVVKRLVSSAFRAPDEAAVEMSADGSVASAVVTRPAASVWVVSWAFDGVRFRQDVETVLPLAKEGRLWTSTTHAYDGQRAFLYVGEASRCLITPSPQMLYLDAIWHLWPGNDALLMPTMLGRCFGADRIGELLRASGAQLAPQDGANQTGRAQSWVLAGRRGRERWTFWVDQDEGFRLRKVLLAYGDEGGPLQPVMELLLADYERIGTAGGWLPKQGTLRVHVPADDGTRVWRDTYSLEMRSFTTDLSDQAAVFTLDTFPPAGTEILQAGSTGWDRVETIGDDVLGYAKRVAKSLHGRDDFSISDK